MARILILGGAGFIGYHLARRISAQNCDQVTLVDNLSRGHMDPELEQFLADYGQFRLVTGDLTRPDTFRQFTRPFDYVYLLAGIVGVRNVQSDPAKVLYTNTSIVLNTLEWIERVGCGRLLFASTSESYAASIDQGLGPIPTSETVPVGVTDIQHPRSTYAITKMLGEATVTHYAKRSGFEAVVIRYHNVYGPRMGMDHVIPELMDRMCQRQDPFPIYGVEQTRAFCYVSDAVEASLALMSIPLERCELVHVGNDQEITVGELLRKILDITGFSPTIKSLPAPSGSVSRRCPDISKLRSLTGFEPSISIEAGLALTWQWYGRDAESNLKPNYLPSKVHE